MVKVFVLSALMAYVAMWMFRQMARVVRAAVGAGQLQRPQQADLE